MHCVRNGRATQGPDSGVFLDVGGNIGVFTLMAGHAGNRVVTIEALPSNAALIRTSIEKNRAFGARIRLFNVAVSSMAGGKLCAVSMTGNPTNGILVAYEERLTHAYVGAFVKAHGCAAVVSTTTIDELIGDDLVVSTMKVDIEGLEYQALRGAHTLLASAARAPCAVVVELNPGLFLANAGTAWTSQELCTYMARFGYTVHNIQGAKYPNQMLDYNVKGSYENVIFKRVDGTRCK